MSESIHGFIYEIDNDGVVVITMDIEGPVNSMNGQFRTAIAATVNRLEAEDGLTGIVFTSAKSTFIAGGDLNELSTVMKSDEESQFMTIENGVKKELRRIEKLEVPVVAAINGAALGGGLELCLACNYRVILNSPRAVIGFPEVTLGLLPGAGGIVRSIHMLGLQKALPFLLEGIRLTPTDAKSAGYVDFLVDSVEDLIPTAKKWIRAHRNIWSQPWDMKGHTIPGGDISNPENTEILASALAETMKKTRGLLPAPQRILSVAKDVVSLDFDSALKIESRALTDLIVSPVAKNIITSNFFQMNSIRGGASRPKDIRASKVNKIGILGAGMMGQGIAYSAAIAGIEVILKDVSIQAAEKGKLYSSKLLNKKIANGNLTEKDKNRILSLISVTDRYEDLEDCDFIIEAVFENATLKNEITVNAEPFLVINGVFATNTSTLPISHLAHASKNPENFIGIHFFSPVDRMPLIEIICGDKTSEETLAKAFDFALQIRKTPIVVNDSLGFFTSRVFSTFLDEGARLLQEGLDPVLIDSLGKQIGMPIGPLAMQDEVSQRLSLQVANTHREMGVYCSKGDISTGTAICEMLIDNYNRGGRYHNGGYYDYGDGTQKTIWPGLYDLFYKPEVDIHPQDIMDRILFRQVLESLRCYEEGVLSSVADGNIGSLLGIGAPAWTGGYLQFVNTYEYKGNTGPNAFIIRSKELADAYGERFFPPQVVFDKAGANSYFL